MAISGSVFVAIKKTNGIWIYYEGGIYSRIPGEAPTQKLKVEYAIQAAGRAIQNYPTVAKFFLRDESDLVRVGEVDTKTWATTFYLVNDLVNPGNNARPQREITDLNLNEYHQLREQAIHFQYLVCLHNRMAAKSVLDLWLSEKHNLTICCAHDISNSVEKENCFVVGMDGVEWLSANEPDINQYPGLLEFVDSHTMLKKVVLPYRVKEG